MIIKSFNFLSFKLVFIFISCIFFEEYFPHQFTIFDCIYISLFFIILGLYIRFLIKKESPKIHLLFIIGIYFFVFLTYIKYKNTNFLKESLQKNNFNLNNKANPILGIYGKIINYPFIKRLDTKYRSCKILKTKKIKIKQIYKLEIHWILNKKNQWIKSRKIILIESEKVRNINKNDYFLIFGKVYKNKKKESINFISYCQSNSYNYYRYLTYKRIDFLLKENKGSHIFIKKKSPYTNILNDGINSIRNKLKFIYKKVLNKNNYPLLVSLIFGDKEIKKSEQNNFQKSGISHILAISGMHVGFISFSLFLLLSSFRISNKMILIFISIFLYAYLLILNFKASILRAVILFICYSICRIYERDFNFLNSLYLSSLIILLIEPYAIFYIDFQLSFLASMSIFLYYNRIENYVSNFIKRFLIIKNIEEEKNQNKYIICLKNKTYFLIIFFNNIFSLTLAAQILIIPLIIYYFNNISFIGFIANLPIIILSQFSIGLAILLPILYYINDWLFYIYGASLNLCLNFILKLSYFFASFNLEFNFYTKYMHFSWIFIYLILIIILTEHYKKIEKKC